MAKKSAPERPPVSARERQAMLGEYRDRCGTRYAIAVHPTYGFGLYRVGAPAGPPHQDDAHELRRLLSFAAFTRL